MVNQAVMDHVFNYFSAQEQSDFLGCDSAQELAEQERRYLRGLSTFNHKFLFFFLLDKNTNKNIGWCGYHTWYTDHHRAEIGYTLKPAYRNKGLMTEAMHKVIKYGFENIKLHRIEAMVGTDNEASHAILKTFKFLQEGILKEHYLIGKKHEDSLIFALLKHDYFSS